jgi:HEAT repeat protein
MRRRQPHVPTLLKNADVEGLIEAARFQDIKRDPDGHAIDQGIKVREQAIIALGQLGADSGAATVTAALRDPFDRVRCVAVHVLRMREEVEALADGLTWLPANARSRKLASGALLELGSARSAGAVTRSLVRSPGNSPLSDAEIAFLLTMLEADEVPHPADHVIIRELLDALADQGVDVADRAEDALARLAPTSTPGLVRELANGGSPERAAAVLGRIRDPGTIPALTAALEDPRSDVRIQATAALGALRDPAAVEPLLRAVSDSNSDVRAEACHALDGFGSAAVIIAMSAVLGPLIEDAVASAVQRLGRAEERTAVPPPGTNGAHGSAVTPRQTRRNGGSPR